MMQASSKRVLVVTVILVLALVVSLMLRQPPIPDQDQIAAQLESARTAAEAHSTGGIMSVISSDYKGQFPASDALSLQVALSRTLRDSDRVRVEFSPPSVIVQGDTATSTCQMTVRGGDGGTFYDKPVTLTWKREDGRRLLVLPTKVWRVVGAHYEGGLPGEE